MSLIVLFMAAISFGLSICCLMVPGHPLLSQIAGFVNAAVGGWNLHLAIACRAEDDKEETN